eukprot:4964143-Alexandrium_andersonii.AAC.2
MLPCTCNGRMPGGCVSNVERQAASASQDLKNSKKVSARSFSSKPFATKESCGTAQQEQQQRQQ